MGLDWSTFFLEVANFLILLWILKRFLYAPVKDAIERRRKRVDAVLAQAQAEREQAQRMRSDYETRQQRWAGERAQAHAELERELAATRAARLQSLEQELQRRREQAQTLEARRQRDTERQRQDEALALAAEFGSKLLSRVADQALEARLVAMALEDLAGLDEDHRQALAGALRGGATPVQVQTAYPLDEPQKTALAAALEKAAQGAVRCEFGQDPELIAGLRIDAGPLVMRANLRDELRLFAEGRQ
jgi:F-type H+-transporting ATPase subunit b